MNNNYLKVKLTLLVITIFLLGNSSMAQNFDNPGQYMDHIGKQNSTISQKYITYISAVSHGKKAKKIEKLRAKLLNEIDQARNNVMDLPAFNGDRSLRDSSMSNLLLVYRVFNEDYAKIVDMEAIAEQSYDAMEAYMLAQEKAGDKLEESSKKLEEVQKEFAKKNNVNLINSKNENSDKLDKISKVNGYYNKLYLLHFKSAKQEVYLIEALETKNLNSIEQNRNALLKNATEGLAVLDTIKGFEGDKSLVSSLTQLFKFYKTEAEKDMLICSDFILKSENFTKMKTDFEKTSDHTKEEVDAFNKAVSDLNAGVKAYNNTNQSLNAKRNELGNNWQNAVSTFMDTHMPYAK
jgi:hypothetical protein